MSFIYLASPYSKFPAGLETANALASAYAGLFIAEKLPVFCPIAHSHSIAVHSQLKAKDHSVWMPLDTAFMESAFALVVAMMDGWNESFGVQQEINHFIQNQKPIYYWQPPKLSKEILKCLQRDWAEDQLTKKRIQEALSA